MAKGLSKAERLREMEQLYTQGAYSDIEMAEKLGVVRTTVFRDRRELQNEAFVPIEEDENGRYRIERSRYISNIRVDLNEALALYLAVRRASRQTRIAQPHVARALEKLARALRQPMTERLARDAAAILEQSADPEQVKIVETVAKAWAERRQARIRYQGLHAGRAYEWLICPYLIEPSLWTDGAYLIGPAERQGGGAARPALPASEVHTFKLERIDAAWPTLYDFDIPDDFDERALLQQAWGVWLGRVEEGGAGAGDEVRLRFRPGPAARRLQESKWHPTQAIHELEGGDLLWTAQVAEWRELLPWVRGWGADCEALAPAGLREVMVKEARELARLYQGSTAEKPQVIYYAHSKPKTDPSEWQRLIDHLNATADLAEKLGQDAGVSELARAAALFHDIGKYSQEFQARLGGSKHRVDHATAGAREVMALFPKPPHNAFAELLSYCIAGHHSGLPDYGDPSDLSDASTLLARREKKALKDYSAYTAELAPVRLAFQPRQIQPIKDYGWFSISFLTRMVFSTLVDADWLETETYMNGGARPRGQYPDIPELTRRFKQYLQRYDHPQGAVNQKRSEILKACMTGAVQKPGFFTLTVPTGGGKTLASMAFALEHAAAYGLKRVIYVIPFTTIIEQNAAVFKQALGDENVLEHHSNFDWQPGRDSEADDDETNTVLAKLKLAAENWDIPIIVTTNVQFFESLFASKKSAARKLHNIAGSVIIFDEAQMLPREFLQPCMLAVRELVQNYGASAVFCTATQPQLDRFLPGVAMAELAPDPQALFDFFRRVRIQPAGILSDQQLAERLNAQPQALCIVNTRRHAKGLFDLLDEDGRFHLSTLMCPQHRKNALNEIRSRLADGRSCRVVSTQVIEAGVDLDFPVGYRALAGLDSIIQAAGRVNRERRAASGDVFVFEPDTPFIRRMPSFIRQTAAAAASVLREHGDDPVAVPAIQAYFRLLDALQDPQRSYDAAQVLVSLNKQGIDFKTAAEKFKLIDDGNSVSIIIPYDEAACKQIEDLRYNLYPAGVLRALQIYTVTVFSREFEKLQAKGAIETIHERYFVLMQMEKFYDLETGVILPADEGGDAIFA